jgi:poly(ADP-ribose) glycohydrolase ARH3
MLDRFQGCLLGLALGDALGAPLEGGPIERLMWRLIGRTRRREIRWTDDTQMALDLAESLIANRAVNPDDLAQRFAASYRWSRGYGRGTARLLKRIRRGADWQTANRSVFPEGSFGNGGAMRAPLVGLFFADDPLELKRAACDSARVTHAHPLGIEGAVLLAVATASVMCSRASAAVGAKISAACEREPFVERLERARQWLDAGTAPTAGEVAMRLGNRTAAAESCVTAVYIALRYLDSPFAEMWEFARTCGGDVDTIGAMAGAVWGAANGVDSLPADASQNLEQRERILAVAGELWAARA